MPDTALKLIQPEAEPTDVLAFERRIAKRRVTSGRVTAVQTTGLDTQANRICSLQLINMSDSGLGTMTQESIEIGTAITVFFPPHGPERGFDLTGEVVRCTQKDYGHEIGICFDARQAA